MIIKNSKLYDWLKWIAQVLLPAAAALYFGLAGQMDLPNADTVVGSITVVDTFLGALLGFSSVQYNNSDAKYDGSLEVQQDVQGAPRGAVMNFEVEPEDLAGKKELLFKVNPVTMDFSEPPE